MKKSFTELKKSLLEIDEILKKISADKQFVVYVAVAEEGYLEGIEVWSSGEFANQCLRRSLARLQERN